MKKGLKITLIVLGFIIGVILLDTIQALIFNSNPIIGMEMWCKKRSGILVDTYHCGSKKNVTRLKSNACYYDDVCKERMYIDYAIAPSNLNDLIVKYLTREDSDLSNIAYNYVDEKNYKVIVGLIDDSKEKQNEFIYNVFTDCCGSDYINFIKEHKLIEFKESKEVFEAKIIEAKENMMTVEVLKDSKSFNVLDKVSIKITRPTNGVNDFYVVGNKVRITFNGMVETSNPAQVGTVKIELID